MYRAWNQSPWAAQALPLYDHQGRSLVAVIVKAGFTIDVAGGVLEPLARVPGIAAADQPAGDPVTGSLSAASEVAPPKAQSEYYLVNAMAVAPTPATRAMEVSVAFTDRQGRTVTKTILVQGRRVWKGMGLLPGISVPEPFAEMPIDYRLAFGGCDEQASPRQEKYYLPNWAGKGFLNDAKRIVGRELPNLEIRPYIRAPEDRPMPAGFGPLQRFWSPRLEAQGRYDDGKRPDGSPYGQGANASMFNCAPLDQRCDQPFRGGEKFTLTNLLPGVPYAKPLVLTLPAFAPGVELQERGAARPLATVCDTVIIDAQKKELYMIARAAIPVARFRPGYCGDLMVYDPSAVLQRAAPARERVS